LLRAYFPRRTDVVLRQFRGARLYPATEPPEVRREGRRLFMDAAKDRSIHFTTDGTDPRIAGGKVAPTATRYTGPVSLAESQTLKARALAPAGEGAGEWSALVELAEPLSSSAP
jgi:hypothetical protein